MADYAHKQTDEIIKGLEKKLKKEYSRAVRETQLKLDDYLKRFKTKDKIWKGWVASGKKTQAEYLEWRKGQIIMGKRWSQLKNQLAKDYHNANRIAQKIVRDDIKDVYAEAMNYSTYVIEKDLSINTSFTLYDKSTVERLMSQNPDMLPPPGKKVSERIRRGKDIRWNKKIIQSVSTQSILQGESIPEMAKRLAQAVGDSNYKSAIRNARTMCTGAENAGRVDSYYRAQDMGILIEKQWLATLDTRTRHSHRQLDGVSVPINEEFPNGLMYPAEPSGDPADTYNCRCTLVSNIKGLSADMSDLSLRHDANLEGMTYDEWKESRRETSRPIDYQVKQAEKFRAMYIKEYRKNER